MQFAHRKCIQRWCNKKGDITCEICNQVGIFCADLYVGTGMLLVTCFEDCDFSCWQVFSPNYTTPPPRTNGDVLAIDIRYLVDYACCTNKFVLRY